MRDGESRDNADDTTGLTTDRLATARRTHKAGSKRRQLLKTLGAAGTAGLALNAGCISGLDGGSDGDGGDGGGDGDGGDGGGGDGGGGTTTGDASGMDLPDKITIIQENVPDTGALKPLLSDFEEKTGITAEMNTAAYETLQNQIPTQLQSSSPSFDVAIQDIYWVGDFAKGGLTRQLDERIANSDKINPDLYFDPVWEGTATYDGKTWGIPFFHYAHAMMYREDLLTDDSRREKYSNQVGGELGIPTTIEEYIKICKFMTRDTDGDGEPDFYGASMQGQRGVPINDEYMNYFQGLGGTFATPDGEVKVDEHEDTAVEALKMYTDNINNAAPEAAKSWKFSQALEHLGAGNSFSMFTYHVLYPIIVNNFEAGSDISFAPVAGRSPPLGGWSWALPSNLSEPRAEAAWRFIEWAESFETRKKRMLEGGSPTCTDVLEVRDVIQSNPTFFKQQRAVVENARPFPNVPGTTQAVQNWGTELSRAVAGNKSPEQAVSDGIERVKRALE